jgi:hypothetical protein
VTVQMFAHGWDDEGDADDDDDEADDDDGPLQ